ncbi:MAG: HAD family hydrolase [Anaerorhabdus sp.]
MVLIYKSYNKTMNTVLFDLDGTLLPMDLDEFIKNYFGELRLYLNKTGLDGDEIIKGVMLGTSKMLVNDGKKTNERVFWETFEKSTAFKESDLLEVLKTFYSNNFQKIENICSKNKNMIDAVKILKDKGYRLICATNPIFPKIATESRLKWSGVDIDAFDTFTTFEDYGFCKPDVMYYAELGEKYDVDFSECLMVGNDAKDDMSVKKLGASVYLVNDHLISRDEDEEAEADHIGSSEEFLDFVKGLDNLA